MFNKFEGLFENYNSEKVTELSEYVANNLVQFNATWHPLGFVIIKLGKTQRYEYRLHIWPNGKRKPKNPDWPIHNHIFDLECLVLKGVIGSHEITLVTTCEKTCGHEIYCVEYTGSGSEIVNSGRVTGIKKGKLLWTQAGCKYSIPKGGFHQSYVEKNMYAASLVRTSSKSKHTSPLVIGRLAGLDRYLCPSTPLKDMELKGLLQQLKS